MISDPDVKDATDVFQQIMLDILQRRAVEEALEERAVGKVSEDDPTLKIYGADYVGSQLADLRKFFETDGRSYKVASLTGVLPLGNKTKIEHARLYGIWKKDYEDLANQYYFHREKGYANPGGISKAALNSFIEATNSFLDLLVSELTNAHFSVAYVVREINSGYFKDIKDSASEFFGRI
jgi:hypothetical protein